MNHKERMLAELPYKSWMDGLPEEHLEAKKKCYEYNHLDPTDREGEIRIIKELFAKYGIENMEVTQITVSKTDKNSIFVTQPSPWLITGEVL